jgi:hypothetical protein
MSLKDFRHAVTVYAADFIEDPVNKINRSTKYSFSSFFLDVPEFLVLFKTGIFVHVQCTNFNPPLYKFNTLLSI